MASTCPTTQYPFQCPPLTLYNAFVTEITNEGGTMTGNSSSGTFAVSKTLGHVDGSYSFSGQTLTVTISSKSLIPTCDEIQNGIQKFIAGMN